MGGLLKGGEGELQGSWPGLHWGRWEVGEGLQSSHRAPMAVCGRWAGQDGRERTQQETLADRAGASWWGRSVGRWVAQAPTLPSGWKWNRSQPCQGAAELGFSRPSLGQMQGQPARRAGEPSDQTEEASSEGLGGHDLLAQADAGRPAGRVVRHYLYHQPGAVGGEAAGRHVVQSDAVANPAHRLPQEVSSAPSGVGPALPQPGQSARRRCRRRRPAADDSPGRRCSCGGGRPPWPGRRVSQMVESRSMVNGASPGPAPARQARASSSRLTRSSWRTWPHRKLRRKVPRTCPRESGGWTAP